MLPQRGGNHASRRLVCGGMAVYARCREAWPPAPSWMPFHGRGPGITGLRTCCSAHGMLWVKAIACTVDGSDGVSALGRHSPPWGRHLGAPSLRHGVLWVKTLSSSLDELRHHHRRCPFLKKHCFLRTKSALVLLVVTVLGKPTSVVVQGGMVQVGKLHGGC